MKKRELGCLVTLSLATYIHIIPNKKHMCIFIYSLRDLHLEFKT